MDWIFGIVKLLFDLWSKRPNPLAQEAYIAGAATEVAKTNEQSVKTAEAELEVVVNRPKDTVEELEAGRF